MVGTEDQKYLPKWSYSFIYGRCLAEDNLKSEHGIYIF